MYEEELKEIERMVRDYYPNETASSESIQDSIAKGGYANIVALYDKGYRKITEGSVVISKEEYEGLKKRVRALEHLATNYSEQIDWDNDASKKTAREILQEFWKIQWGQSELDNVCLRLAKEYGVEVEE